MIVIVILRPNPECRPPAPHNSTSAFITLIDSLTCEGWRLPSKFETNYLASLSVTPVTRRPLLALCESRFTLHGSFDPWCLCFRFRLTFRFMSDIWISRSEAYAYVYAYASLRSSASVETGSDSLRSPIQAPNRSSTACAEARRTTTP